MKPIIGLIALVLLASVQPVLGQASTQPQIAFQAWEEGKNAEIYTIDADGQNLRQLTDNDFFDGAPVWSPDGQQMVFVSDRDDTKDDIYFDYGIYTMDADGQNVRLIFDNVNYEAEASWSPDGQWIAVLSDAEATQGDAKLNCVLNIMKPDGSERKNLFTALACNSFSLQWSPDSSHLLLSANDAIYSVRVADANAVQLTAADVESYAPVWSPDGSKIAYVVNHHESSDNYELYLMNADGSSQKRLTDNPLADVGPRFTGDGAALLFSSGDDKSSELYLFNLATNAVQQLTDTKTQKFSWDLSPDSSKVVYSERSEANEDTIYLLDIKSLTTKPLGETVYKDAGQYSWRPMSSGT